MTRSNTRPSCCSADRYRCWRASPISPVVPTRPRASSSSRRSRRTPTTPRFHGSLGIAYAGLGRRADAVREAKLGCDLMPASKDAMRALFRLEDLALVYTMVGQPGEAIAVLDDRLSRDGDFTAHMLRLDPAWDPLRSDPRFQALLTKYEVKP